MAERLTFFISVNAVILTLATPPAWSGEAKADAVAEAVAYALTGTDNTNNMNFDKSTCTAVVRERTNFGHKVLTYHLNQVFVDRLEVGQVPQHTWYVSTLRSDQVIFEQIDVIDQSEMDPKFTEMWKRLGGSLAQKPDAPISATDRDVLVVDDPQRTLRAWNYIFSHGCTGRRSAF